MIGKINLLELVDLSLGNPDAGAVNFIHLRKLLLGIVKAFPPSIENDINNNGEDLKSPPDKV